MPFPQPEPLTEVVTQERTHRHHHYYYTEHDFNMLQHMEGDSACDGETELLDESCYVSVSHRPKPATSNISENEFSCHCCYDILVNPTTLTCGHNFCRHCLALWWESSHKNECPECREKWEGFPKINILLRDATDKLFSEVVQRRRMEIQANPKISRSLLAFQKYGDNLGRARTTHNKGAGFFFSGVLTALTCVAVVVLVFHWGSGVVEQHDLLISKPVSHWTAQDVGYWLENLGPWTEPYRGAFQQENVNGRLLLMLGDEELLRKHYNIENSVHRRAVLAELDRVKTLGVKPPQNLWEYKAANAGKSLFLLYALKRSPRLTIFYLYLFDYSETFLPFLHTCCPPFTHTEELVESSLLKTQLEPSWQQWVEFLVKYCVLPYQLIAEFAWDWLAIHYWTSRFIIVNAMLLSILEGCFLWRLWTTARLRTLPQQMWNHSWKMLSQGFAFALMWPFVPQFVCNCLFYWALYFSPIINIDLVVQQLMHPETQAQ
ncbi:Bifunctional apoptosis regulator [Oryzias melastigma]|uniref:Bifunctional apoptosis regulator n=1 Tax=Oryzias melastigma TaxID=30732 RepID=A0A834F434_ORYME|nr:Bifunctional apoptosis regulator [Oryzias melastigma]